MILKLNGNLNVGPVDIFPIFWHCTYMVFSAKAVPGNQGFVVNPYKLVR